MGEAAAFLAATVECLIGEKALTADRSPSKELSWGVAVGAVEGAGWDPASGKRLA